jgi:uncharacterized protein (TIGR00730 family)
VGATLGSGLGLAADMVLADGGLAAAADLFAADAGTAATDATETTAVANPVSDTLARVIPAGIDASTLGAPGAADVFVTNASELEGLNAEQISDVLTIPQSPSGFQVIEFATPEEGGRSPTENCLKMGTTSSIAMRICVYCASSEHSDPEYRDSAFRLGELLAQARCTVVYGGGSGGSMGALANGALSRGGEVIGVLPRFMADLEWGHPGLTRLELVEDMRERKHKLLTDSDAVIALPGGCGTLEELLEAITLKRLGLYPSPIVMVNTRGFYTPLDAFLRHSIAERFMNLEHADMWRLVERVEEVIETIRSTPLWSAAARRLAVVRKPTSRP